MFREKRRKRKMALICKIMLHVEQRASHFEEIGAPLFEVSLTALPLVFCPLLLTLLEVEAHILKIMY